MKFEDILFEYLLEQVIPPPDNDENDDENVINPEDAINPPQENGDTEQPEEPEQQPEEPENQQQQKQPQGLSKTYKKVIEKWKAENPGLVDTDIETAINFFNTKKGGLRPLNVPGQRNMPEIVSFAAAFPEFFSGDPARDIQKLKDIQSYSWAQMEFFIDAFNTDLTRNAEVDYSIVGAGPEEKKQNAYKKWETLPSKIIDEGGIIVHRIQGKDESIALGILQHILNGPVRDGGYGNGANWCITIDVTRDGGSNLYSSYRTRRAFYFIMDRNKPEEDKYFISAIGVVDPYTTSYQNEKDYVVTPRPNGDETGKKWEDIVRIWPGLRDKRYHFQWFGQTKKERVEYNLDQIRFDKNDRTNGFIVQPYRIKRAYIDSNRNISYPSAFLSLPEDLQSEYVERTRLDNYDKRFVNRESSDKFGMLSALRPADRKRLDFLLKSHMGIPSGVNAIKSGILSESFKKAGIDQNNNNLILFQAKPNGDTYGILDLSTLEWIRPIEYVKGHHYTLMIREERKLINVQRYDSRTDHSYFYWAYPSTNITKDETNPNRFKGLFYNEQDGDDLLQKYPKLSMK